MRTKQATISFMAVLGLFLVLLFCFAGIAQAGTVGHYIIRDDATGGDCPIIGNWDSSTKTCTLTIDVSFPAPDLTMPAILISGWNITIDGNGHSLTRSTPGGGTGIAFDYVQVSWNTISNPKVRSATIKNLSISNFSTGINLFGGDEGNYTGQVGHKVTSCNISESSSYGIRLSGSDTVVSNNTLTNGDIFGDTTGGTITNNTIYRSIRDDRTGEEAVYVQGERITFSGNTLIRSGLRFTDNINAVEQNGIDEVLVVGNYVEGDSYLNINNGSVVSDNVFNNLWIMTNRSPGEAKANKFLRNTVDKLSPWGYRPLGGIYYVLYSDNNFLNSPSSPTQISDGVNNHFGKYDSPAEGCNDANSDGYCDNTSGGIHAALIQPIGCSKPQLNLTKETAFWASYVDYLARKLSVSWNITNAGNNAFLASVDGSSNTGGVTVIGNMPNSLGNMVQGSTSGIILKYSVPVGVGSWRSTLTGSSQDGCGTSYTYP